MLGTSLNEILDKQKTILPRTETHYESRAQCKVDNQIEVALKVREVTNRSITFDFKMVRRRDNILAAEGYVKRVAVDLNSKVVELPVAQATAVRESIDGMSSSPFKPS